MIRGLSILALCCVLAACHRTFGVPTESVQEPAALASVKTIYVEDLSHGEDPLLVEGSDLVKEKILARLSQSKRFSVVDAPDKADATLTGVAGFQRWYFGMESFYGLEGSLNTQYSGVGMVRLLDSKTKEPIWTHEYETGLFHPTQSVADRVANQVADKLLRDATPAGNQ
jgi:TolB-like protein